MQGYIEEQGWLGCIAEQSTFREPQAQSRHSKGELQMQKRSDAPSTI